MATFWQQLRQQKGFLRLQAPMEAVSDIAFRAWLRQYAPPDVYFTEFASLSGLLQGQADTLRRLANGLSAAERQWPLVAQLWGSDARQLRTALPRLVQLGYDGVDLNFGCPHKKIVAKPAGSGLLQTGKQGLAVAMLRACIEARRAVEVPPEFGISVKTRLGFERPDWQFLAKLLQCEGLDALTVHFRLAAVPRQHINHKDNALWAQYSGPLPQALRDGPCYWQFSGQLLQLREQCGSRALLIGSGGLGPFVWGSGASWQEAEAIGLDGWMAARALFDDPLYLSRGYLSRSDYSYNIWQATGLSERSELLRQHLLLYRRFHCPEPDDLGTQSRGLYEVFKKFYSVYLPKSRRQGPGETRLLKTLQASGSIGEALGVLGFEP